MRTVVKSGEVYHLWAHQTQEHARCGNQSFRGTYAYSYNEVIAELVKVKGEWVALHTSRRWSVTTSGHQSGCRGASSHLTSFTVPAIAPVKHKENLAQYRLNIEEAANKASRARTEWPMGELTRLVAEANRYAETFGLATRFEAPAVDRAALKERIARKAEKDRIENARRERQREDVRKAALADYRDKLSRWLAGESVSVPYFYPKAPDYLRIEGEEAVTTQGARVPLEHVRRVLPVVLGLIREGRTYEANGHTIHLGHYSLDRITAEGTVIAGCHRFERGEVERFAALAGRIMPAP